MDGIIITDKVIKLSSTCHEFVLNGIDLDEDLVKISSNPHEDEILSIIRTGSNEPLINQLEWQLDMSIPAKLCFTNSNMMAQVWPRYCPSVT